MKLSRLTVPLLIALGLAAGQSIRLKFPRPTQTQIPRRESPQNQASPNRQAQNTPAVTSATRIRNGDYDIEMLGCTKSDSNVTCELEFRNLLGLDRTMLFMSAYHDGTSSYGLWRLGRSRGVGADGVEYVVDSATMGSQPSSSTGQTYWKLYAGTTPRMKVLFTKIGPSVSTFANMELVMADRTGSATNSFTTVFQNVPLGTVGAAKVAPAVARPQISANQTASQEVRTEDYGFHLTGCRRMEMKVTCEINVANLLDQDRDLLFVSKKLNGIGYDWIYNKIGFSEAIDDQGRNYVVERASLGNQPSRGDGQTWWQIYQGTRPKLTIEFENVGVTVAGFSRIDLHTAGKPKGVVPFRVVFQNIAIFGSQRVMSTVPPVAQVDGGNVRELPGWRFALTSCSHSRADVGCTIQITNLQDTVRRLNPGTDKVGLAKMVTADGELYSAIRGVLDNSLPWPPGLFGEDRWVWKPFETHALQIIFSPVRPSIATVTSVDVGISTFDGGRRLQNQIRFGDVSLLGGKPEASASVSRSTPLDLTPLPNLDEQLFLLNTLEWIYSTWQVGGDTGAQVSWFSQSRELARQLRAAIRERNMGTNIATLYDDFIKLGPSIEMYLTSITRMDQQMASKASAAIGKTMRDGIAVGALGILLGSDPEDDDDVAFATATDAAKKARRIAKENDAAKAVEHKKMQAELQKVLVNLNNVTQTMVKARGWKPGEAGFEDLKTLKLSNDAERRPRDPYLVLRLYRSARNGEIAEDFMKKAENCVGASRMIPEAKNYQILRAALLDRAVEFGLQSVRMEKSAYRSAAPATIQEATQICRAYLSTAPDGDRRTQLSRACEQVR